MKAKILRILSTGRTYTPDRLASMCGCSTRTLRKHVNALRSGGVEIHTTWPGRCYCMARTVDDVKSTIAYLKLPTISAARQERALRRKAIPRLCGQGRLI